MTRDRSRVGRDMLRFPSVHGSRITVHASPVQIAVSIVLVLGLAQTAGAEPYAFGDIRLGSSFDELSRQLDFRDIHSALEAQRAARAPKPDLGRRGFGCMRGANAYADVVCVSHDERAGGEPTREIRLQFLDGVLQKFSITVEIGRADAIFAELRRQHGAPHETRSAAAGAFASQHWRNADSTIAAYEGRDLVFVSFELEGYAAAVAKRQRGAAPAPP